MSEELEWELYDIFESGLFAFPIYEHNTARRIIQYLLYRGVLDEEIADAIEDSTQGLWIWLHRHGKNMVGEWVIMWINECRDEWKAERARDRKQRREQRKLLRLAREISPNRETTTTFESGDFCSDHDLAGHTFDLKEIHASDLDLLTSSPASRSRKGRDKKIPEPSAPDETLLQQADRASSTTKLSSKQSSPRSPRSLKSKKSQSDTNLHEPQGYSSWDQSTIHYIDSSLSTIHSETDQDESIGDILTKRSVEVIIEHVNTDNEETRRDELCDKDQSDTAKDNQNNNIEKSKESKVPESDSEKDSDIEHMDTKITDSESESERESTATGGKKEEPSEEQEEYVVVKRRKRNEEKEDVDEEVIVIEKTIDEIIEDVNRSMSDIISETMSDYNEPTDLNSISHDSDQSQQSKLRDHKELTMKLVLEGYYKSDSQQRDFDENDLNENTHDSGINTPDLTNDTDPLSPTEKDFFFNKAVDFDDTFSEIFYDAEHEFDTSSRGQMSSTGDVDEDRTTDFALETSTSTNNTENENQDKSACESIVNEIKVNIENDRRLVATMLNQKKYAEIIEVDIPYDLKFPHERKQTGSIASSDSLSICNDCSLTRRNKNKRSHSDTKRRSRDCSDIGLPVCAECRCTIAHYSYQSKPKPMDHIGFSLSSYCDVVFCDSALKAMEFNIDTLDKEGPGFIFVMTEALGDKQLPWSTAQRYKIASSRQPDRWILEFKSRNIEVDVVWQIRVQNHPKAVKEVHNQLQQYNLHTNWFRCSLSVIIEVVLNIASKYRVNKQSKHSTYS